MWLQWQRVAERQHACVLKRVDPAADVRFGSEQRVAEFSFLRQRREWRVLGLNMPI